MTATATISPSDRRLLNILQANGRISNQDLALAADMSASACWRKIKLLEEKGVIENYTALLDPALCGLDFHAVVHVVLSRHQFDHVQSFVDAVLTRTEVLDCFATTGDADYHLRVMCADRVAYNEFLENFLFQLDGIAKVTTNMVLRQIKHQRQLPL